jgi:hypothetical protein
VLEKKNVLSGERAENSAHTGRRSGQRLAWLRDSLARLTRRGRLNPLQSEVLQKLCGQCGHTKLPAKAAPGLRRGRRGSLPRCA